MVQTKHKSHLQKSTLRYSNPDAEAKLMRSLQQKVKLDSEKDMEKIIEEVKLDDYEML